MVRWEIFVRFSNWAYSNVKKEDLPQFWDFGILGIYNKVCNKIDELAYNLDDFIFVLTNFITYYIFPRAKIEVCKTCVFYRKKRCYCNVFSFPNKEYIFRNSFWCCDEHTDGVSFRSPRIVQ